MRANSVWRYSPVAWLVIAACASAGAGTSVSDSQRDARYLVTEEQLSGLENLNAFQALQRLKPTWLSGRGPGALQGEGREGIRVYLDRVRVGDLEALHNIPIRNVQTLRFLDSRKATVEFGIDHSQGAILVTTRRG